MGSMPGLLLSVINVTWAFTVSHDLEMFLIALPVSLLHSLRVKYLVARGEAFGASELPFIKGPCVPGTIQVFTKVSGARAAHLLMVILGEDGVADLGELAPGQGDWEARGPLTTVMPAVQLPEFKWRGWPRTLAPNCPKPGPKKVGARSFSF